MSSSTTSHPLFSTLLSFSALILLYFPAFLWTSLLSPPVLLAGLLFLSLLRLGATQCQISQLQSNLSPQQESQASSPAPISSSASASFEKSFVQWNVRAPLEVIYEDYEEEEEEEEAQDNKDDPEPRRTRSIQWYPSLSLYYPETDSDSSSVDEMENVCFMWDEEDEDRDELIEIDLDNKKKKPPSEFFQLEPEEDNLIEIDISPTAFPMFINI
ncbi:uncharacterized protein LOC120074292 [Benincasa hispida]|uniref:uncharacterized protein LOC120074292 n=1 Tax=Benincasa hispida TaxID=102211 RepID=UPI0018FFE608|nr:uncharacterized protein LOC120074292 [Benincasa hispida]